MEEEYVLDGKIYTASQMRQYAKQSNLSLEDYIYESGATVKNPNKYVLDGKTYTDTQLKQYAKMSNLNLEDYLYESGATPVQKKKISSASTKFQEPQAGITESPSEDGLSVTPLISNKEFSLTQEDLKDIGKKQPTDMSGKPLLPEVNAKLMKSIAERPKPLKKIEKQKSYMENIGTSLISGLNDVNKMIASIPETIYNLASIPQNAIAYVTGLDISTNADKYKKNMGITNPILDYYKEEGKKLEAETAKFNEQNYKSSSIYQNIEDGNYQDAFELLGTGIVRSAPTSIAIMAGGATMSAAELATVSTAAFYDQNLEQLQEENPDASDIENNMKALGMSAAESVFSSIGQGQIGAVYRDIIRKEGVEVGQKVFKDGLIEMYKGALKKYGVPVGLMGEGIEESATQITQNMISGKPAFEGAADAFILGGGSGVMFTAPMSLKNANDRINNKVKEIEDKKQISLILDGSTDGLNKIFDVAKDSEINEKQLSIASLDKSRDLLVKELDRGVKKGEITKDQAKQSLYIFDKTKQITGQLRGVDIDNESKVKVANLLKERESLSQKIQGKDEALSVLEKQRIAEINEEIKQTILKPKETASEYIINEKKYSKEEFLKELEGKTPDELKTMKIVVNNDEQTAKNINEKFKANAIQKQTTDESVLRTEQPEVGLQEVGEGDTQTEVITEQGTQEVTPSETITTAQEVVGIPDEVSQPIELTVPNTAITQPEEVKGTFLENILDKIYEYTDPITGEKLKGNVFFDGQEVVFTDSNKEFSLGTVQDILSNNSLNATEVTPTFNINEDGTIDILQETDGIPKGKITPQGAGLKAIKTDKDGNVKRVVITDANGVTHSIKGELANDLAEVMMFDLAKQGGLTKKINNDETARETFNRGVREANAKRKGKDTKKSVQGLDRGGRVEEGPTTTPTDTAPTDTAPAETTAEIAPVADAEQDIANDLKNRGDIEDLKHRKDINHSSTKIEYNGDSKRIKDLVDRYNKLTRKVEEDGSFSTPYGARLIENLIRKGIDSNQTRKLSSALRKAGLLDTTSSQLTKGSGGIGLYISDTSEFIANAYSYQSTDRLAATKILTKLAKELGVDVASLETEANRPVEKIGVEAKAEVVPAETTAETAPETKAEVTPETAPTEVAPEEIDKINSDIEASKERLKKAWDKYKTMGIAFDPKNNLARDKELVNSLIEYAYNNIRLGSYNASKFIKDLAEQGFEITKDGAKFIIDKATQKIATEETKAEIKDLKGQVVDVFKAAIDAIKIVQATAKEKAKNIKEISQQLIKDIKELESTGKITPTQAINMISKFNKVNMLNEVSVSNFIDYMTKVFADADYDNKIKVAKGKLKAAKKNINTKIGIANGLAYPLQTLFSINPSLIPIKNLERYMELVDMFSARKSILQLDEISQVINDVNEILDEINTEQSLVEELSYRLNYSNNQVIEDGKLNYADTVKNMVKEGDITEEEAALMTKYKSEIVPKLEQTDEEKQKKKEELEEEKKELENELKKSTINASDLPTRDERNVAKRLAEYLRKPFIKQLNNVDLKNLLKAIDNINNGYLPHQAELILEKLDGFVDGKTIDNSIEKANLKKIAQLVNTVYNTIKSKMTDRDAIFEMIRRTPLFNIDQILGDFKTEDLYYALLGKSAKAEAKFTFELKTIQEKLQKAQNKVAKSFGLNPLKSKISNYKIKTYLIQLEHNTNPGDERVNQASEYIKATIKHINRLKSQYNENDVKILEDILNKFAPDGNIDINKLYNSFNNAEKEAIKTLQEVKKFESEKAEFTAAVIRGKRINPLNNHTHISVLGDNSKEDLDVGTSFANEYNKSLRPSTKAKSLMERTPGAKPINFDAYSTALRSAKYVLMDYHLTAPVRTARKSMNATEVALEKDGDMSKEQRRIFKSVNDAFELAISDLVNNSYVQTSTGQDIINSISKQGYRAVLAGLGKSSIELLSNLGFVVFDPFTFYKGAENMGIVLSEDLPAIMNNSKSIQTNRVNASGLSGRMIDLGILDQSVGTKSSKTRGKIINKAQQVWNLTVKKFIKNPVELTADSLISSPDKVIMKPYWLGSYITELEKQLGRKVTKEGDLKKIAENDEQYMNENEAAIEAATRVADRKSKLMGATKNGFAGLLRGKTREGDKAGVTILKNFNAFMTNFMVYEYNAAKTGVMAAIGDGTMTRSEGASVLAGVITRMTVYNLLIKSTTAGVSGLLGLGFGLDDDDEEEEKTINQLVTQSLASTFASLMLGRDFGNISKTVVNYGFEEYVTKEYLEGLRTGEYDPYKDAILFNSLQRDEKTGEMETWENIPNFMGSYGPIAKTGALAVKVITSKDKKKSDAIERQEKERNIRLPLEILGNSGYIPLYKEIRKSVMDDIYKDLKNKKSKTLTREEYYKLIK